MPDYRNSKIYTIRSHQTNQVYVGSTTQRLSKRFSEHKSKTHRHETKAHILFAYGDAFIELLEKYPCNDIYELRKREGEWIRKLDCVNKQRAGIQLNLGRKEYRRQYLKEYRKNKPRVICDCNGSYTFTHKTCHLKTKQHKLWAFEQHQVFNHL